MKFERVSILILAAACLALYIVHFTAKQDKLVYVDSNKLLNNYKGMLDARTEYQNKAAVWKSNVDTLLVEVQRQIMSFEKESAGMTKKERELSQELIRTKQQQLADYQKAIQSKAQQEDVQMTQTVLTVVNEYLKRYGESKNYHIILAATDAGNIVYAQEGTDITDEVLVGLNQEYSGS
ncbi:MAG: OmpH family outer membrane protein [Bacteroidota bacterium]